VTRSSHANGPFEIATCQLTIAAADEREIIGGIAVEWLAGAQTSRWVSRLVSRSLAAELGR